ncbi:HD domain-containing protein [Candidatus Woesearchaeota archaeon]|nr:HD domain-containing protein [Candidatus Woesearchaeota archaeon]
MEGYDVTKARRKFDENVVIDPFLFDYSVILQSKAYRRLPLKTQVITTPENPYVRTRLSHTNEVLSVALTIAQRLNLNTNLVMAIAAGHDIGHTPYGHLGEKIFSEFSGKPFRHYVFSVVVAQEIERKGLGLNLTYQTLDGILKHSRGAGELQVDHEGALENSVVMFSDKIAYLFSDTNDALRMGLVSQYDLPECVFELGFDQRDRVNSCIDALVTESLTKGYVDFSESREAALFKEHKDFMYNEVYFKIDQKSHADTLKRTLDFISKHKFFDKVDPVVACACLTDNAMEYFKTKFDSGSKLTVKDFKDSGLFEIIDYIRGREIDYTDAKLNW